VTFVRNTSKHKRTGLIESNPKTQNHPNRAPLQHQNRTAAAPPSSKTTLKQQNPNTKLPSNPPPETESGEDQNQTQQKGKVKPKQGSQHNTHSTTEPPKTKTEHEPW
jgi:hypothetical protein